jgi:hypothetical protein
MPLERRIPQTGAAPGRPSPEPRRAGRAFEKMHLTVDFSPVCGDDFNGTKPRTTQESYERE